MQVFPCRPPTSTAAAAAASEVPSWGMIWHTHTHTHTSQEVETAAVRRSGAETSFLDLIYLVHLTYLGLLWETRGVETKQDRRCTLYPTCRLHFAARSLTSSKGIIGTGEK